jgi:hypothetical protein
MPIKYDDGKEPDNILVLEDELHKPVITIKATGEVDIAVGQEPSDAAQEFWQAVVDFIPVEKKEQVTDRLMLIKAYNLLNDLQELTQKDGEVDIDDFEEKFREIKDYFYVGQR